MRIGGFTRIFDRPSFEEVLDAAAGHGLEALQLNLESAGLPPMPDRLDPDLCRRVRDQAAARGLTLAAVSGTFNIIHPDLEERARNFRSLRALAAACPALGAPRITFSTGTRNADYMWASHPDNGSPVAWSDMLESMAEAVEIAAEHEVPLVFEPEVSNVVDSAPKARLLLDHFGSPFLKVVIDGANLFGAGDLPRMAEWARSMLRDSLDAFVREDTGLALDVCQRDDFIDDLTAEVFGRMLGRMAEEPETVVRSTRILFLAKYLERIADHATNIAEMVIYMVKGKNIRHVSPVPSSVSET